MNVNHRTSLAAVRNLVAKTHLRVQGRTAKLDEQHARHQREQKDKPEPRDEGDEHA